MIRKEIQKGACLTCEDVRVGVFTTSYHKHTEVVEGLVKHQAVRPLPHTWEAQRTGDTPLPEKVGGARAWVPRALGRLNGEQMAEGMLWGWKQVRPVAKVFGAKIGFSCK